MPDGRVPSPGLPPPFRAFLSSLAASGLSLLSRGARRSSTPMHYCTTLVYDSYKAEFVSASTATCFFDISEALGVGPASSMSSCAKSSLASCSGSEGRKPCCAEQEYTSRGEGGVAPASSPRGRMRIRHTLATHRYGTNDCASVSADYSFCVMAMAARHPSLMACV